jgi:hypothetical protein
LRACAAENVLVMVTVNIYMRSMKCSFIRAKRPLQALLLDEISISHFRMMMRKS